MSIILKYHRSIGTWYQLKFIWLQETNKRYSGKTKRRCLFSTKVSEDSDCRVRPRFICATDITNIVFPFSVPLVVCSFYHRFVIFLSQGNSKFNFASSLEAQTKLRKGSGNSSVCGCETPRILWQMSTHFSLHRAESYDQLPTARKSKKTRVYVLHNTWHLLSTKTLVFRKEDGDFQAWE